MWPPSPAVVDGLSHQLRCVPSVPTVLTLAPCCLSFFKGGVNPLNFHKLCSFQGVKCNNSAVFRGAL